MTSSYSLLIVEPDHQTQSSIQNILVEEFDIQQVLTASTEEEALSLLSTNKQVNCVITDCHLNNNAGYHLANNIKHNKDFIDTTILLMSDKKDPEHILQAAACGASDLILKPFTRHSLTLKLKKLIGSEKTRKHTRIATMEAFDVNVVYSEKRRFEAKLLDISEGECTISAPHDKPDGRIYDKVTLDIYSQDLSLLTTQSKLIRVEKDDESENLVQQKVLMTFQFDRASDKNTSSIRKFLSAFSGMNN